MPKKRYIVATLLGVLCLFLGILLVLVLDLSTLWGPSEVELQSRTENEGLETAITSISWRGDHIDLELRLRYLNRDNVRFWERPWTEVELLFWNEEGWQLEGSKDWLFIDEHFN